MSVVSTSSISSTIPAIDCPILNRPRHVFTGEGRRIWCRRLTATVEPLEPGRETEPLAETKAVDKPLTMEDLLGEMEGLVKDLNDGWRDLTDGETK
ncbi:Fc.00g014600.m01.CDS01 [Cosmosporella sp. VM-42]